LTGLYGYGRVIGAVSVGATQWTFGVAEVAPPAGAYRSTQGLRDKLDASWVVLPDGSQVGVDKTDGTPGPAQPFNLTSSTTTADDGTVVPIIRAEPR
jgi:serine/threonine-protein kinase